VPVLGFAASPWTLACYMVEGRTKEGFATVKEFLYREPKVFEICCTRSPGDHSLFEGTDCRGSLRVQLFDTWCGELDLHDYTEFVLPAVQEIIAGLGGSVPVILLHQGVTPFAGGDCASGCECLERDWRIPLGKVRELAGRASRAGQSRSRGAVCAARTNQAGHAGNRR